MDASRALQIQRPDGSVAQAVLIVDDEPDILSSLRAFLEGSLENVHIHTAKSGEEGLQALEDHPVDLILADFRMPGMDGLTFLAEARKRRPQVPRILMTAFPDLDITMEAINEKEVERFFTKPMDPSQVVETVRRILASQRSEAQRKQAYARALNVLRQRRRDEGSTA